MFFRCFHIILDIFRCACFNEKNFFFYINKIFSYFSHLPDINIIIPKARPSLFDIPAFYDIIFK